MAAALSEHSATCFSHGDLLLRNVLSDPSGGLSLVDWECAGPHAAAWDDALLWVFAPEWVRGRIEAGHVGDAPRRALLASVAFALSREVLYRGAKARRGEDRVAERLLADRARVLERLR
jgi:aminoglycoside phosphotransferase (APT) family kinase protein